MTFHLSSPQHLACKKFRSGFTLIEILVVVSIILVLLGLGVVVNKRARDSSYRSQTVTTLRELTAIETEYRTLTGAKPINHATPPTTPFDWNNNSFKHTTITSSTNDNKMMSTTNYNAIPSSKINDSSTATIERFIAITVQVPNCRKIYTRAESQKLFTDIDSNQVSNQFLEIVDGWGTPIRYFEKYTWENSSGDKYKGKDAPTYARPFFVSAGTDAHFGWISNYDTNSNIITPGTTGNYSSAIFGTIPADKNTEGNPDAEDNIYSFKLE